VTGKRFLVLGGGIGGLVAANELRRQLGQEHEVALVDRRDRHLWQSSMPWVMIGTRTESQITRRLTLLNKKGINTIKAEIEQIDIANKKVVTSVGTLLYDYLVVSLGVEMATNAVPGFKEAALNYYDLDGVARINRAIRRFRGGRVVILIASHPYKCPVAPYEAAFLLDAYFRGRKIRKRVSIELVTPETQPLPVHPDFMRLRFMRLMRKRRIKFTPDSHVESVDTKNRRILLKNNFPAVPYDLLIGVPPHRPPAVVRNSQLSKGTQGWIPVDRHTMWTKYDDVYAIGDVTRIKTPLGEVFPWSGFAAESQAKVVAANLVSALKGERMGRRFSGTGP